jgi:hypothetical protein
VNNLIGLADQVLRGVSPASIDASPVPCLTFSEINEALSTLNEGFDKCRTVCACAP